MPARRRIIRTSIFVGTLIFFALLASGHAREHEKKQIVIKTPGGSIEASADPDPALLGLPIYPGAKLLKGDDEGGLDFNLAISGKRTVRFAVNKYRTADSMTKVRDYYKKQLAKDATKVTETKSDGSIIFEIKHKLWKKIVQVGTVEGVTEIELVRIEGVEETSDTDNQKK